MPDHHAKPNLGEDLDMARPDPYPFGHPAHTYSSPPQSTVPQSIVPQTLADYPVGLYDPPIPHRRNPSASALSSDGTNPYAGYVSAGGTSSPPPTTHGSEGSAQGSSHPHSPRPMLSVANPGPNAAMTYPPDVKDRTLYLRADTGYEYHGPVGASSSSAAIAPQQTGSSMSVPQMSPPPVVQHQDGGAVSQPGPSTSSSQPNVIQTGDGATSQQQSPGPREEKRQRPSRDANNDGRAVEAPPAYSE